MGNSKVINWFEVLYAIDDSFDLSMSRFRFAPSERERERERDGILYGFKLISLLTVAVAMLIFKYLEIK